MDRTKAKARGVGGGNVLLIGVVVIAVVVVAAVILLLYNGNGAGSVSGSGTDVIAQAFSSSSNQTLTGAQLANLTAQYSKTAGPVNVTYTGMIKSDSGSQNYTIVTAGTYNEDFQRENGDFRADILLSTHARLSSRYYSNNVSTMTRWVAIGFTNGTSYGCSKVLNITPPDPQLALGKFTCHVGQDKNNTIFNFSNQFGSTPYVKYKLVGKSSVLGIPCDLLVGNGTLNTPSSLNLSVLVNVRTCVSFKYLTWLNSTIDFHELQAQHGLTSNSSMSSIATALNNNVPANFTQLPPNATIT